MRVKLEIDVKNENIKTVYYEPHAEQYRVVGKPLQFQGDCTLDDDEFHIIIHDDSVEIYTPGKTMMEPIDPETGRMIEADYND